MSSVEAFKQALAMEKASKDCSLATTKQFFLVGWNSISSMLFNWKRKDGKMRLKKCITGRVARLLAGDHAGEMVQIISVVHRSFNGRDEPRVKVRVIATNHSIETTSGNLRAA